VTAAAWAAAATVIVGVDGRSLAAGAGQRGIARYVRSLLTALTVSPGADRYAVLVPGRSAEGAPEPLPALSVRRTRIASRPLFAAGALLGRPRLDRLVGSCDVVWAPAVAPLAISSDVPFVLTVHDLSFEHRAGDYSRYQRVWHGLARPRQLAQRADRVIAVSEAVRRELIEEWRIEPEKIVTVPSGPGRPPAAGPTPSGRALPAPGYVLAVGALEPRKRPELLVEAHGRARAKGLSAELVFAGEGPLRERLAAAGATTLGYVPDERLDALYRNALALVCVSREEGFAFTPLEALARGTPAVVSDLPVFTETLGDGALRVPAGDGDALAEALLRLEHDRGLRSRLAEAGRASVARLSWSRAAASTHEVLAGAAGAGR